MTDKTRYVTVLFGGGDPTWFLLDPPPAGLDRATVRMKVGSRHYFLTAAPPVVDAATGTTVIFVQALTHHSLWGTNIAPDGRAYQFTKIDRQDFEADANWHKVADPFAEVTS